MYWYVRIENINDVTLKKCTEQIKKASRKKTSDEDGIRTHACRAQWISSPSP